MAETAISFNDGMRASKNLRAESYMHCTYNYEVDGKCFTLNDEELYIKAKYLEKDGKTYAESNSNYYCHVKNEFDYSAPAQHSTEQVKEVSETAFLKDKNIGYIRGSKDNGHRIIKYPSENIDINDKWDENNDKALKYIDINSEDYLKNYQYGYGNQGILILYSIRYMGDDVYLIPYNNIFEFGSGYSVGGVYPHLRYATDPKAFRLLPLSDEWLLPSSVMEVDSYSFTMQADDTKVYIKQEHSINVLDENDNSVIATIDFNFAYYQDNESDLTANNFKDNYITEDVLTDIYYYDCDKEKVAADFMAGKEVVITPVGNYDPSVLGFDDSYAPYIDFNYQGLPFYIAGKNAAKDAARIENGKLIIDSESALKMAKEEMREYASYLGDTGFDIEKAKMYLVIPTKKDKTYSKLYIPLN